MQNQKLEEYIGELFESLNPGFKTLEITYTDCKKLVNQYGTDIGHLDMQSQNAFEALVSRFARLSDILVKQILVAIDELEGYEEGSPIDVLNRAEKKNIIESAAKFRELRALRNKISHEYSLNELNEIYVKVLDYVPMIIDTFHKAEQYTIKILGKD
jgi:uncharacterized protein YutE (UPF0331/DUF86 family)